jgi:NADPH:quinone reductase-like Zn-dependent oxidoreductase
MKAAIVTELGKPPAYGDFSEPTARPGEKLIRVSTAALSQLTRGRASGRHYSSSGSLPFVVGVDGVGVDESGKRIYFALPSAPYGSMAEKTLVRASHCVEVPNGLDDVKAAAMANPGMSSWAALTERAKFQSGETVLINGATGTSGRLAVQIAKYRGAKKIIATGRNLEVLNSLRSLGADVVIPLTGNQEELNDALRKQFQDSPIDVVLDYIWGKSAEQILLTGAKYSQEGFPIRFIQIGTVSGADIQLPGAVLRSSAIQLMGSGMGSISLERLVASVGEVFKAAVHANFRMDSEVFPLSKVESAWVKESGSDRIVFTLP